MGHGSHGNNRGYAQVVLYDCDDFTRKFYMDYMGALDMLGRELIQTAACEAPPRRGVDQLDGRIDVSEKPLTHLKLAPPPHNGVGKDTEKGRVNRYEEVIAHHQQRYWPSVSSHARDPASVKIGSAPLVIFRSLLST